MPCKEFLRRQLAESGWFVRKIAGLPAGISLEHDLLKRTHQSPPKVIFDIGAHHGETAESFARSFPQAKIFSFEPVRANFSILEDKLRHRSLVTCHHLALSNRTGEATIVLQSDSQTHTLESHAKAERGSSGNVETVQLTTLDEFAGARQIARIDLLKIDTEGHEIAVLSGARHLFSRHQIGAVFLEATLDDADTAHTQLSTAIAWLQPLGFRLTALYDQTLGPPPTRLSFFNALFLPDGGRPQ